MLRAFERAWNARKLDHLGERFIPPLVSNAGLPLPRVLLWTCFCAAALAFAFVLDPVAERWLTLPDPSDWTRYAGWISKTGEGWVVGVAGILGFLVLFWRAKSGAAVKALIIAFTGLATGAAATVLRSLIGRTRPSSHELQGFYGVWHDSHWILGKYEFGAFPSGHAATVIGVAAAAWLINRRLGLLLTLYALMVTWSRVALGCHHFSDTVAAAIVGIVGAHLIFARFGPRIFAMSQALQNGASATSNPEKPR